MSNSGLFEIWAPADREWSEWAKPVLFATLPAVPFQQLHAPEWPVLRVPNDPNCALILELPRELSILYGVAAARRGFWPVPLFNCAFGPNCVLNVRPMLEVLALASVELNLTSVQQNAPPAFLLDSRRMQPDASLLPGHFDNRYLLFPEDFPSGGFLKARQIQRVLLVRTSAPPQASFGNTTGNPQLAEYSRRMQMAGAAPKSDDLAHVLLRWQQSGLDIYETDINSETSPRRITITPPSRFRSIFYRALALMGLRRNSAGGFGGIIPQPSSGGS